MAQTKKRNNEGAINKWLLGGIAAIALGIGSYGAYKAADARLGHGIKFYDVTGDNIPDRFSFTERTWQDSDGDGIKELVEKTYTGKWNPESYRSEVKKHEL
jgi:hypothetical protein